MCGIDESSDRLSETETERPRSASHLARGKLVPTSRRTSSTAATGSDFSASSIASARRPAGPKTTTPALLKRGFEVERDKGIVLNHEDLLPNKVHGIPLSRTSKLADEPKVPGCACRNRHAW